MLSLRPATAPDAPLIVDMIHELAEFEREGGMVEATAADLLRDGFGAKPRFFCIIAEWDGEAAGYAFYFFTYSTWAGRPGLFLEDLYVREEFRGKGIGKAVLRHLARLAVQENCYAMSWEVLAWNTSAIEFYRSLDATFLDDWRLVRLMDEALHRLAEEGQQA
jgi:GNAT superfamily N-acetyltransferase